MPGCTPLECGGACVYKTKPGSRSEYVSVNHRRNEFVANHKSAEKRSNQAQERRLRNRVNKSQMKTEVRKVNEAVAAGTEDAAKAALQTAISVIAKTASKGSIHKRTASRKISRLAKRVNKMEPLA